MTLSEIIIRYRKDHNLSQRQFALQCGVSNGYISMLEDGINRNTGKPITPSIPKLKLVAAGMGMTLHELFGLADDMEVVLSDDSAESSPLSALAKNIKRYRYSRNLGVSDAASRAEVTTKQWLAWERGTEVPTEEELIRVARMLRRRPEQFLAEPEDIEVENIPGILPIRRKSFPLLGEIACGVPTYAEEEHETMIESTDNIDADFCLRASGDSMAGAQIDDGDMVFIKQMDMVENGDIAAVLIENETTLKRVDYNPDAGLLILMPDNPSYRPLVYKGEELNQVRILGRAVMIQKIIRKR